MSVGDGSRKGGRPHLVQPVALAVFVGALGGGLVALVPSGEHLEELSARTTPSELSIQHLAALHAANPTDAQLRLLLAKHRLAVGMLEPAAEVVRPLLDRGDRLGAEARWIDLEVTAARFRAIPDADAERPVAKAALERALRHALADERSPVELEEAASLALEIGLPSLAADVLARRAVQAGEERPRFLAEAAQWRRASGQELAALALYDEASRLARARPQRLAWGLDAIDAALASGRASTGLPIALRLLDEFPTEVTLLERAMALAASSGRADLARDLGRRLGALGRATDARWSEAQIDRELGAGDVKAALRIAQHLLVSRPNDAATHARVVLLAEWSGESAIALTELLWLCEHGHGDDARVARALAIARMLRNQAVIVTLLELRARSGNATDEDVLALASAYEDAGRPEAAAEVLWARARRGGSRFVLVRLAHLELARGNVAGALDAWTLVEQRFGLEPDEAVAVADIHWRAARPADALATLKRVESRVPLGRADVWQRVAELGWDLDDDAAARRGLVALEATSPNDPEIQVRLFRLERQRGAVDAALAHARNASRITGQPTLVLEASDLLVSARRDAEALAVLDDAGARFPSLASDDGYHRRRGERLLSLGRRSEAKAAFQAALRANPRSLSAATALLGMALDEDDKPALRAYVDRLLPRASESPGLEAPLGAGLLRIGRGRDAARLLERAARRHPRDVPTLTVYADALEASGESVRADRVRERALALAIRDARAKRPDDERVALAAYLASRTQGAVAARRWLGAGRPAGAATRDAALREALAEGDRERARDLLMATRPTRSAALDRHRLALAVAEGDEPTALRLLADPSVAPAAERAEALRRVGHPVAAYAVLTGEPGDDDEEREARRIDLAARARPLLRGTVEYDALGELHVYGGAVEAAVPTDLWIFDATAAVHELRPEPSLSLGGPRAELEGSLGLRYVAPRLEARVAAGANERGVAVTPYGRASVEHRAMQELVVRAGFVLHEVPTDVAVLRFQGVRDALDASAALSLGGRTHVELSGRVFLESTAPGTSLAQGGQGSMVVVHDLLGRDTPLSVFASSAAVARSLTNGGVDPFPVATAGAPTSSSVPAVRDLLPEAAANVLGGLRAGEAAPFSPWGRAARLHWSAVLSGGWLWPYGTFAFEARGALGVPVFGDDRVELSGYYARGLVGSGGDAFRGVALGYVRGL